MEAANIPTKFAEPFAVDATSSYIRTIPETTSDPNAASLQLGFPPNTFIAEASGGKPPDGRDLNGLLNQITSWIWYLTAGGPLIYDATYSGNVDGYPAGAWLQAAAGDAWWVSQVDNNTTDPDTGGSGWLAISFGQVGSGNPNGNVAGNAPAQGSVAQSLYYDQTGGTGVWICTTTGTAMTAVWSQFGSGSGGAVYCGVSTGTANAQVLATPASMTSFVAGSMVSCKVGAGLNVTGATTFQVGSFGTFSVRKDSIAGAIALTGNEIRASNAPIFFFDGALLHLINPATGTASLANVSSNTGTVAAVNGATVVGDVAVYTDTAGTVGNGPAQSASTGTLAAVHGAGSITPGHILTAFDANGTAQDGGPAGVAGQNFPLSISTTIGTGAYDIDSSAGSFTVTTAASPSLGDNFSLTDVGRACSANPVTWNPAGNTINGQSGNFTFDLSGGYLFASFKLGNWSIR